MTGCMKKYVVVAGGEKVEITQQELNTIYSDNEMLLKSLKKCHDKVGK